MNNIKLIINCEIYGEHPKCGPIKGLELDSDLHICLHVLLKKVLNI